MSETMSPGSVLAGRTCSTCGHSGPANEFYDSTPECRKCKRTRSRLNRAVTAEKVALAERLLEIIERLTASDTQKLCLSCAIPAADQASQ